MRFHPATHPQRIECGASRLGAKIEETLVVGGQEGYYLAKLCIDLITTLKGAETFAKLGILEKSVVWEKEGILELV